MPSHELLDNFKNKKAYFGIGFFILKKNQKLKFLFLTKDSERIIIVNVVSKYHR